MNKIRRFLIKHWLYTILFLIIICQIMMQLYLCYNSTGFDIDEMTSLSVANSTKGPFVDYNLNETWDQWIDGDYIKSYFVSSMENRFNFSNVIKNSIQDVHPPLYYLVYYIVSSFFPGNISRWIGIGINLIFFIMIHIIIQLLITKLLPDNNIYFRIFAAVLYGFSLGTSGAIQFIRMYMLVSLFTVLSVYIHEKIWMNECVRRDYLYLILITCGGG